MNIQCPCCRNPWTRAAECSYAVACDECFEVSDKEGVDPKNMDLSVKPTDNFYKYANGTWIKSNPIPSEYPAWNTFIALHDQNLSRLKELLGRLEAPAKGSPAVTAEEKVAAFYAAANDEEAIEAAGVAPLQPVLATCALAASDKTAAVAALHAEHGVNVFFATGEGPDDKNADWSIIQMHQGGLGLPDRDYYFDEDKADKRALYVKHVAAQLRNLEGDSLAADAATAAAESVLRFETSLAAAHLTRTERRDPDTVYNPMSLTKLGSLCKGAIDWPRYFELIGKKECGTVCVDSPPALANACRLLAEADDEALGWYLRWHAVRSCAAHLPKAFDDESFGFFGRALQGQQEQKPRWKRAMSWVEGALGEAVGELYVAAFFRAEAKQRALETVEAVRQALEARLRAVPWMGDATRAKALEKMNRFGVKIGYPDEWIDFSSLQVDSCHLANVLRARAFEHTRQMGYANAQTDRKRWLMLPQQINAYYHPNLNEIVFPAAILQPPFFDADADDATNFGAMGAVVGHEMTHGFDDQGRKFDELGNLHDWWSPPDADEYEKRVEVQVTQANDFKVHGKSLNGKLCCGENVADLGGLRLAYTALQRKMAAAGDKPPLRNGFTAEQRFFLSWGTVWRENCSTERALQLLTLDPHGPNEYRVNGPLTNMAEFHDAFGGKTGDPMWRDESDRVDIW